MYVKFFNNYSYELGSPNYIGIPKGSVKPEDFKFINFPQEIRSECNQLTVINTGAATAVINGVEIAPGDQYISPGNENELN
jgi:hypothetical protein